ncbi:gag-polypeptide of LTR copia-type domain-containing protein [Phthorimaea operculella]|nr:gag-polypeptide of LTR copia-type domain-containing protein [Phthorimaea operculella]
MELQLIHDDLWELTTKTPDKADAAMVKGPKARARICLMVKPECLVHVQTAKTAKEAWDGLKAAYEDKGINNRCRLLSKLVSLKLEQFNNMRDYVTATLTTVQRLRDIGKEIDDEMVAMLMLQGLTENYQPFRLALETKNETLTSDYVKLKLLQLEDTHEASSSTSTSALTANRSKKSAKQHTIKKQIKCYICEGPHKAFQCPQKSKKKGDALQAFAFADVKPMDKREITCANGEKVFAKMMGMVSMKEHNLTVNDVWYVPNLSSNLMSVSTVAKKGFIVVFKDDGCDIYPSDCVRIIDYSNRHPQEQLGVGGASEEEELSCVGGDREEECFLDCAPPVTNENTETESENTEIAEDVPVHEDASNSGDLIPRWEAQSFGRRGKDGLCVWTVGAGVCDYHVVGDAGAVGGTGAGPRRGPTMRTRRRHGMCSRNLRNSSLFISILNIVFLLFIKSFFCLLFQYTLTDRKALSGKVIGEDRGVYCLFGSKWDGPCGKCLCTELGRSLCQREKKCTATDWELERQCAPDTMWHNDCNTCWCSDQGRAMCTRIGCPQEAVKVKQPEDKPPKESNTPVPEPNEYNDNQTKIKAENKEEITRRKLENQPTFDPVDDTDHPDVESAKESLESLDHSFEELDYNVPREMIDLNRVPSIQEQDNILEEASQDAKRHTLLKRSVYEPKGMLRVPSIQEQDNMLEESSQEEKRHSLLKRSVCKPRGVSGRMQRVQVRA